MQILSFVTFRIYSKRLIKILMLKQSYSVQSFNNSVLYVFYPNNRVLLGALNPYTNRLHVKDIFGLRRDSATVKTLENA